VKKPLLLLVDDEPTVLEALEAELEPRFGDLCRIEPFDSPQAVLDALPHWENEQRAIAVAIVDQKMPGMTGVELLRSLRASALSAPTHLRAILLTGYAGVDSAIAAKNEAGVDRYFEKPWRGDGVVEAIRTALRGWLEASGAGWHYSFREVTGKDEVRDFLRLRFSVYAGTDAVRHVLPDATSGLDVDSYDPVSRFFGLVAHHVSGQTMIGTLRIAGQNDSPARHALERIVDADPVLLARVRAPRHHPLPLMSYLVDREAVQALFDRLTAAGEAVVEAGRLTLDPAWRSRTPGSERHLARHILDGAVAFCFHLRLENVLVTCVPPHVPFYRPYGFVPTERHHDDVPPPPAGGVCLSARAHRRGAVAGAGAL
jgi:two-component system, chemotaxis family, chemotaxis protein CheY